MTTLEKYIPDTFGLESHWLETKPGERTHYHDVGTGPVVLFIHGSGIGVSAAANWWQNIPALTGFRSVAFDLIGFGSTQPAADEEWGMRAWIDQVLRVLDALKIERAFLVGNSLGGRIALHFCIEHPERTLGLITMGAVGINPPRPQGTPSAQIAHKEYTKADVEKALRAMIEVPEVLTQELIDSRYRAASAPGAPERFSKVIEARNRTTAAARLDPEELAKLQIPVLLTHGREDRVIPYQGSVEMAHIIPNADLHVFSKCGHWAQTERLVDFNNLLRHFVSQHS